MLLDIVECKDLQMFYIVSSSAFRVVMGIYDGYYGTFILLLIIFYDINFIFIFL